MGVEFNCFMINDKKETSCASPTCEFVYWTWFFSRQVVFYLICSLSHLEAVQSKHSPPASYSLPWTRTMSSSFFPNSNIVVTGPLHNIYTHFSHFFIREISVSGNLFLFFFEPKCKVWWLRRKHKFFLDNQALKCEQIKKTLISVSLNSQTAVKRLTTSSEIQVY